MWYKIWTSVAELVPIIVLSLILTVIAVTYVVTVPQPPECILCGEECPGHPFNFKITIEK